MGSEMCIRDSAIGAAASGDIFGAITGGIGALGGMFPGTFGGVADKFGNFMSNNPFGKALGGFMQGGIGGALGGLMGGLGSILPEGVSGMLNKFGGFMKKFPAVGGLIGMIPGVANVPGLSQLFGLDSFGPHGFSPMGLIGNIADSMGFGGLFRTITGMMGGGGAGGMQRSKTVDLSGVAENDTRSKAVSSTKEPKDSMEFNGAWVSGYTRARHAPERIEGESVHHTRNRPALAGHCSRSPPVLGGGDIGAPACVVHVSPSWR